MKKIWVCGIYKSFDLFKDELYRFNFEYNAYSFDPIVPIRENENLSASIYLIKYLPINLSELLPDYESYILLWHNNENFIKSEWFKGIINIINHLKDLDRHGLVKLDHDDLNKNLPKLLDELEKHKNEFPELWI